MLKIYQLRKPQNSFEVTLKYKGVGVRVTFVDGNTYNDIPAKCYTSDPFKQKAIENSQMFKNREIVLERTVEDKNPKKPTVSQTVRAQRSSRIGAPVKPAAPKPAAPKPVAPAVEDPEPEPEPPVEDAGEGSGENEVTYNSLSEAIVSIMQKYGKEVRTENEARKFLKEQGITAHIKKG